MKKILITGANGFIAKNLIVALRRIDGVKIYEYTKNDSLSILKAYIKEVDFIYHLAGVNRPKNNDEFYTGNYDLTKFIIDILIESTLKVPILFSSSMQAILDNVYGKWSKPNYNSVISTWCYNIIRDLDIKIDDADRELNLVYVDDVVDAFIQTFLQQDKQKVDKIYCYISNIYNKKLGYIANLLYKFKMNRKTLLIPHVGDGFERALYATYLSYLEVDDFSYELSGHHDDRGSFYEILKTLDSGQFSISTTEPGITRGNHYHNTKNEKFLVVQGKALIEFRHIITNKKISYEVSDSKMEVVEMIPGYTHNIKNIGNNKMFLLIWANEVFDKNNPDTFYLEV